jgi:uncharacterized alkaline shock family protein YloU
MADSSNKEARSRSVSTGTSSELITEHGKTTIHDVVVAKIAARAAREIPGVRDLVSEGVSGFAGRVADQVTGGESMAGVNVEVGEREAAVDLGLVVDYEVSIPRLAQAVRDNIMNRVNSMTGLQVREVNIDVIDLALPEEAESRQSRLE